VYSKSIVLGGSRYDRNVNVCMADTEYKDKNKNRHGNMSIRITRPEATIQADLVSICRLIARFTISRGSLTLSLA
jgi:hypothetical protein